MRLWLDAQISPRVGLWIESSFDVESLVAVQAGPELRALPDALPTRSCKGLWAWRCRTLSHCWATGSRWSRSRISSDEVGDTTQRALIREVAETAARGTIQILLERAERQDAGG